MMILPYISTIFKLIGVWPPIEWSSGYKFFIFSMYSFIVFVAILMFILSEFVYVLQSLKGDIEKITNVIFMLLAVTCTTCKFGNLLLNRRKIMNLIDILNNDICRPSGPEEITIENKFDRKMRTLFFGYGTAVGLTVFCVTAGSFVSRTLPFYGWIPFDCTTLTGFWCACIHQVVTRGIAATVACSYDLFFFNVLNLACAQLNILKYRLRSLTTTIIDELRDEDFNYNSRKLLETKLLTKFVRHHLYILKFVRLSNENFNAVIFMQCTASTLILCTSTYIMKGMTPFSSEFTYMLIFMNCMLGEIFLFCWYGNEIMSESIDIGNAVYTMKWPSLTIETQKNLVMLIARSSRPMKLMSGNIIVLSLDTYVSLLKLSYSVYNLLGTSD